MPSVAGTKTTTEPRPTPAARALPRVRLAAPSAAFQSEFLAAVQKSEGFLRPWVYAPTSTTQFEAYLDHLDGVRNIGHFVLAPDGGLAGVVNLNEVIRGVFCSAFLGYYALAPYQGTGCMKAGLTAVIRRAFGRYRLHRVEANVQPGNAASIGLVQTVGFRHEGLARRYLKIGGRWRDHERWALTVEDWHGRSPA